MASRIEAFYPELGARIQSVRNRRGVTQQQLGLRLNPPNTRVLISNIESGKQRVLLHTLAQIATALEVTIEDLLPPGQSDRGANLETSSATRLTQELENKLKIPKKDIQRLTSQLQAQNERRNA